ncbi:MAG: ATP-binding cassette domain-containing protein [Candidatus Lokiarchaeota archaeon]|nr:ATP-binding cassette domain-containing protein [Candidatus Lokiarchaeota archaeon]
MAPVSKLAVQNIKKSYSNDGLEKTKVLDGISFAMEEGEFTAIVGPSGCGKTTLLKIIAGLLESDEGQVRIDDHSVGLGHSRVGYIFQQESLFPWLNVEQNIRFGLDIMGYSSQEIATRTDEMLDLVGLEGLEKNYPHEISGGQARRVEMARSLITRPDILVSDEAFSNLDAQTRNYLQDEFLRIWENTGSSILFVTHNVDEAVYTSDRILVLSNIPSKIIAEFEIDIPRPRDRTSKECIEYRAEVLEILKVEQQKAMARLER